MIKNVFIPDSSFDFPAHEDYKKSRRFQFKWLQDYKPWLAYSKVEDGGFCLACVLFAKPQGNVDTGALVTKPLCIFNKANELLRKHSTQTKYHTDAMSNMYSIIAQLLEH